MKWTELHSQAADSTERAQFVLDAALAAAAAAHDATLDAEIAAELPTTLGLCAVLDAYGVRVPGPVAARVCWYASPRPARAPQEAPVLQDFHTSKQPAF